jgi:hypothetical protein
MHDAEGDRLLHDPCKASRSRLGPTLCCEIHGQVKVEGTLTPMPR